MLKFTFIVLILANLVIGCFTFIGFGENELHEPERLTNQLNAEKLVLLPANYVHASTETTLVDSPVVDKPKTEQALVASPPEAPSRDNVGKDDALPYKKLFCIQTTELPKHTASALRTFVNNEGLRNGSIELHKTVVQNYITFIPAKQGKLGAAITVKGLQQAGVSDYYVLKENSDFPWAVSLGVFSTEIAANAQRNAVQNKGISNVLVRPFKSKVFTVFKMRDVNEVQAQTIRSIVKAPNIDEQNLCSKT